MVAGFKQGFCVVPETPVKGHSIFETEVNSERLIQESDDTNDAASIAVEIKQPRSRAARGSVLTPEAPRL